MHYPEMLLIAYVSCHHNCCVFARNLCCRNLSVVKWLFWANIALGSVVYCQTDKTIKTRFQIKAIVLMRQQQLDSHIKSLNKESRMPVPIP